MVDSQALLPMLSRLREEVPGTEPLDAHTHLGANDPDGYRCSRDELVAQLELIGAQAVVFPMHEPDGYPPANDMVLAEAEATQGRLFAVLPARPGRLPREPSCAAAWRRAPAGSSSTRGPRASTWTTRASTRSSRSPTSSSCRSSATPAAASRRSAATRSRSARATPACG